MFSLNYPFRAMALQPDRSRRCRGAMARLIVAFAAIGIVTNGLHPYDANASDNSDSASERKSGYKLGPLDKVRVKIFEWRPSRDEVYNWLSLNGEYTISANGMMAFPLLGEINAGGLTSSQLARTIGKNLQARMGLAVGPNTTIEVSEYRPFYIVGDVERPGAYPFRPGLTVLQAVSIAGGFSKKKQLGGLRLERELIASQGKLRLLSREIAVHMIRKARLEAELNNAPQIDFRAVTSATTRENIEQEKLIFQARNQAYKTQVKALNQLKDFLAKEVVSIAAQLNNHRGEASLLKKELRNIRALANKGLVSTPRKLAIERNVMQMSSGHLRLESRLSRVRQELGRTEIVILELQNKRRNDVTVELQKTQIELRRLQQQYNTGDQLLYETKFVAPRLLSEETMQSRVKPDIKIVRRSNTGPVQLIATEMVVVRPGDTIKIVNPLRQRKSFHLGQFLSQRNVEQAAQYSPLRTGFGAVDD